LRRRPPYQRDREARQAYLAVVSTYSSSVVRSKSDPDRIRSEIDYYHLIIRSSRAGYIDSYSAVDGNSFSKRRH
jgi:hypothetical protein